MEFSCLIAPGGSRLRQGHIDPFDVFALVGNRQRKPALVTEAIEHIPDAYRRAAQMIFPLIQERTGLLAFRRS